ncbi:MAG: MFS transporter [Alphaproteobacteria bacterium]|jgi:OFA family oxalate/formate antiporter-like MFS transporter
MSLVFRNREGLCHRAALRENATMRPIQAFAAAIIMTTSVGTIHAFSVFVAPLEESLESGRDTVSLAYSLALVSLTLAVLIGPQLWRLASPAWVAIAAMLLAAVGTALSTLPSVTALYLGYGLLFGFANGTGYGFALVIASNALPERRGVAMGVVTAMYAVGASAATWLFRYSNTALGHTTTLLVAAGVFALLGLVAAFLLWRSGLVIAWPERKSRDNAAIAGPITLPNMTLLWLGFGAGSMAGLMALGHAAEVVRVHGGTEIIITVGVMVITATNALGGFATGWLADKRQVTRLLIGLPVLAILGLLVLSSGPGPIVAVAALSLVQISYGGVIALYPIAVTLLAGATMGPTLYGRIFTAWGVAGFAGPWLAGLLYEQSGHYETAFLVAAGVAVLSSLAAWSLRKHLRQST